MASAGSRSVIRVIVRKIVERRGFTLIPPLPRWWGQVGEQDEALGSTPASPSDRSRPSGGSRLDRGKGAPGSASCKGTRNFAERSDRISRGRLSPSASTRRIPGGDPYLDAGGCSSAARPRSRCTKPTAAAARRSDSGRAPPCAPRSPVAARAGGRGRRPLCAAAGRSRAGRARRAAEGLSPSSGRAGKGSGGGGGRAGPLMGLQPPPGWAAARGSARTSPRDDAAPRPRELRAPEPRDAAVLSLARRPAGTRGTPPLSLGCSRPSALLRDPGSAACRSGGNSRWLLGFLPGYPARDGAERVAESWSKIRRGFGEEVVVEVRR